MATVLQNCGLYIFLVITILLYIIYSVKVYMYHAAIHGTVLNFTNMTEVELFQLESQQCFKNQEEKIEKNKIRDLKLEDVIFNENSAILPDRSYPNSELKYLCRNFPDACVRPFARTLSSFRTAPNRKLAACLVQKSASTAMYGTICYLKNETDFKLSGRDMLKEIGHLVFCRDNHYPTYESLNETFGGLHGWKILYVKRDPIDRFLSGYLDLCLQRLECLGCFYNLTCFMERLLDRHCGFARHQFDFTFLRYSNNPKDTFLPDLVKILNEQNASFFAALSFEFKVPNVSIDEIVRTFTVNRTVHSTVASGFRKIYETRLRESPYLLELLIRIFYYDFELLQYDFPL